MECVVKGCRERGVNRSDYAHTTYSCKVAAASALAACAFHSLVLINPPQYSDDAQLGGGIFDLIENPRPTFAASRRDQTVYQERKFDTDFVLTFS